MTATGFRSPDCRIGLKSRLTALADTAREMAMAMDFAFLLDPERKLLSIGYSPADNSLDPSCYDLLASEARLASLFAIAKGDVPTRHWFRLGREATPLGNGSALISWSGSMFEYLMPSLVMRAPVGSLLEQTNRLVVERQESYGRSLGIPWGISESAYNARDMEFTYQYSNFGVPGLGLKRGLSENVVIAPYATGLAAMVDPHGALQNYARLAEMGALRPLRLLRGARFHPLAASRRRGRRDRAQLHGAPSGHDHRRHRQCSARWRDARAVPSRADDPGQRAPAAGTHAARCRRRASASRGSQGVAGHGRQRGSNRAPPDGLGRLGPPVTHLLSNGRYAVMLTAAGRGLQPLARYCGDALAGGRDPRRLGLLHHPAGHPKRKSLVRQPRSRSKAMPDEGSVAFGEDRAEFIRHDGALTTTMDVLVSGEDDGEVRRVSLTNSGRHACEIELTSYAELVLTTPAADNAHPAFAKMFVQTEYLAEFGALVATRRRRSRDEPEVWAAHFAVVEGEIAADPQYETDRARFLGRGRTVGTAAAIADGRPLSNTVGTVLDPIFSLRHARDDSAGQGRAGRLLDRGRVVPGRASRSRRQAP